MLAAVDGLPDDKLPGFALRVVLTENIPRVRRISAPRFRPPPTIAKTYSLLPQTPGTWNRMRRVLYSKRAGGVYIATIHTILRTAGTAGTITAYL